MSYSGEPTDPPAQSFNCLSSSEEAHTRQGAHCVRGLSEQMHQEARTQRSVLAQPLPVDKWTQTEMVREDIQLPRKVPLLCISFQDGAPTLE